MTDDVDASAAGPVATYVLVLIVEIGVVAALWWVDRFFR